MGGRFNACGPIDDGRGVGGGIGAGSVDGGEGGLQSGLARLIGFLEWWVRVVRFLGLVSFGVLEFPSKYFLLNSLKELIFAPRLREILNWRVGRAVECGSLENC